MRLIAGPFLVLNVAFLFQHAKHRAHGGLSGCVRQNGMDFGGGCVGALVENVHDLALPAAELLMRFTQQHPLPWIRDMKVSIT